MKIILLISFTLLLCCTFCAAQQMDSIYFQYFEHKKSPEAAFCLSLLLPSMGQLYNGSFGKFLAFNTVMLGGTCLAVMNADSGSIGVSTLGKVIFAAGYLLSVIDAPVTASAKNARERKRLGIAIAPCRITLAYKF
jgi:hypothetical protein